MSADTRDDRDTEVPPDRAVVDRIVDGRTAVLQVGAAGDEFECAADLLPEGAGEGTWVVLDTSQQPPAIVDVDRALTDARAADVSRRLERIRQRRRGGRFNR